MPILYNKDNPVPNPWLNLLEPKEAEAGRPPKMLDAIFNYKKPLGVAALTATGLTLKPSIGRAEQKEIQNPWFTPQGSEDISLLTPPQKEIQNPWLEGYQPKEGVPIISRDKRLDLPIGMIRATPPTTLQTVGKLASYLGPDLGKIYMSGAIAASIAAKFPIPWQGKAAVLLAAIAPDI